MWKLRRPKALLDYYEFNEDLIILGHMTDANQFLNGIKNDFTNILIPYRFDMDFHQITQSLPSLGDHDEITFFIDRIEIINSQEESRILKVPKGIICKWFLRTMGNIESHAKRLVFIDSCPHTWDGIDNVFLVTVGIRDNLWCQQPWGEPGFLKNSLQEHFCLDAETVYSWGNDTVTLALSNDGMSLDITSGFDGSITCTVPCKWKGHRWVVDQKKLAESGSRGF